MKTRAIIHSGPATVQALCFVPDSKLTFPPDRLIYRYFVYVEI